MRGPTGAPGLHRRHLVRTEVPPRRLRSRGFWLRPLRVSGPTRVQPTLAERELTVGELAEPAGDVPGRGLIVWRWGFVGPQRTDGPSFDSLLTVTIDGKPDGGTALSLVHERLDALAAAMPQVADGVAPGWESALDKLAEVAA